MATLLDDRLVTNALEGLEEWSGDHERIRRTVHLDDAELDRLLDEVKEAADAMDHHPEVERADDCVTFTLWTHSAGGVTELDIALASRIDDLVLIATGRTHSAAGEVVVMEPAYPSEDSVPSRPGQAETGGTEGAADEGRDAPTMNQPASPRQGAGPAALPDDEPGTVEPSAMGANAPGLHERTETADG